MGNCLSKELDVSKCTYLDLLNHFQVLNWKLPKVLELFHRMSQLLLPQGCEGCQNGC